jgi:hypothetical protein
MSHDIELRETSYKYDDKHHDEDRSRSNSGEDHGYRYT